VTAGVDAEAGALLTDATPVLVRTSGSSASQEEYTKGQGWPEL